MPRAFSRAAFLMLSLSLLAGCATYSWYYEPAVYQIRLDLPLGTSQAKVDAYLTEHDIEHSYLERTNQITALVRNVRRDALVQADVTLTFSFDGYRNLTDIDVKPAYTKP